MKIYDVHIHSRKCNPVSGFDGNAALARFERVGVYGGGILSTAPTPIRNEGTPHERLDSVLKGCAGHGDRLLPIFWIHPDEPETHDIIQEAAARGIIAFKVICNSFYPYEDKCLRMLETVAKTGRPVMFHSGILWDDTPSSKYNRPLHWEALCKMPGLRFSLAHCAWPWYDETIALYGKFLTNHMKHPDENAEMFFDLTPGTPVPYRRDLYTKLLGCGYDVEHNILWGTDCNAEDYHDQWTEKWLKIDNEIMDDLGTEQETRELIFHRNAECFFGLTDETHSHVCMRPDGTTISAS